MSDVEKLTVDGATYELRDAYAIPKSNIATNWTSPTTDTVPNTNLVDSRLQVCETNILYSLQTGVKNIFDFENANFSDINTTSIKTKDSIAVSSRSGGGWCRSYTSVELKAGSYVFATNITNYSVDAGAITNIYIAANTGGSPYIRQLHFTDNGVYSISFDIQTDGTYYIIYYTNDTATSGLASSYVAAYNMICTKAAWDQEPNVYRPFARSNYDLTVREQQDRNALVEVVDEGVKNVFDLYHDPYRYPNPITATGLTATIHPDGTISVTGTPTTSEYTTLRLVDAPASYFRKFNGYYLSGSVAPSGKVTKTLIMFELASSPYTRYGVSEDGNPDVAPLDFPDSSSLIYFFIRIYNADTTTPVNLTFKPMITTKAKLDVSKNYEPYALPNTDLTRMMTPFFTVPINHNMIYRGYNLGDTLTDAQHTALSSGNFTDLYLGDYWTKTVTIPAGTYTGGDGEEVTVPAQTNITLKAVIADFDTFYAGYIERSVLNTHHAAVIVTGFSNVVWNSTNTTAGGYAASLIHKWLVGSALPQLETWFGSSKVLSHQKLLTDAITGDAASSWAWGSEKISLLSENQIYGSKIWGGSRGTNGAYEPGEAFKHLNVFNHVAANLLFNSNNIWLRDIGSAAWSTFLDRSGSTGVYDASSEWIAPAALILLS